LNLPAFGPNQLISMPFGVTYKIYYTIIYQVWWLVILATFNSMISTDVC